MATQIEVGTHIDLSDRQVRALVADGVLPASKGAGGLDIDACRLAYIRYLRGMNSGQVRQAAPDEDPGIDPLAEAKLTQERLRLTSAQAEAQELKNQVTRRRLIPVEAFTFILAKVAPAISSTCDTLPLVLRRRHPDVQTRFIDTAEREMTKIRNTCAQLADRAPEWIDEFLDSIDQ
jgi:phage terminase Nu1 subunit (DNA packaging protein)